ncbi:hypothetical protein F0562_007774 [Nyssa sinensis]|uniref:Uncharacterized protein n=1 Tax=Nyssa sinensis TaxID=561372 RepID=A0A5J5A8I2_9ASTE|nr:hypothetical protein F0562_007774 [Nyssa sinensis]
MGQGQLYCSGRLRVHLIPGTSLNPDVRHHRPVAKALSESRSGEIKKKIKSGLESVYPGIKNYAYPLKVLVQFWALKAAPDGRRYLVTTSDRIFRLSNYDFFVIGHTAGQGTILSMGVLKQKMRSAKVSCHGLKRRGTVLLKIIQSSIMPFTLLCLSLNLLLLLAQHSQSQTVVGLLEIVVIPNYNNNSGYAEADEEVTKILEALEVVVID